jgi:Ni/Fe-hydrogenase subunit HybB-like protein
MVIVESYLSKRAFGRHLEMDLLEPLGRAMVVVLGIHGLLKFLVLRRNGALVALRNPGYEGWMFLIEVGLGVILPMALLSFERIRTREGGLVAAGFLAVLGFVMNRLNVSVTGMERAAGMRYLPSWMEIAVSLGLVAVGMAAFALAVRHLPIFEPEETPAGTEEEIAMVPHAGS